MNPPTAKPHPGPRGALVSAVRRSPYGAVGKDAMDLLFSRHAVQRFQERVRPALDLHACEQELRRLVRTSPLQAQPPAWLSVSEHQAGWVMLGDDACLICERTTTGRLIAVTTMARGTISETAREARKRQRRNERQRRAFRRRIDGRKPLIQPDTEPTW